MVCEKRFMTFEFLAALETRTAYFALFCVLHLQRGTVRVKECTTSLHRKANKIGLPACLLYTTYFRILQDVKTRRRHRPWCQLHPKILVLILLSFSLLAESFHITFVGKGGVIHLTLLQTFYFAGSAFRCFGVLFVD